MKLNYSGRNSKSYWLSYLFSCVFTSYTANILFYFCAEKVNKWNLDMHYNQLFKIKKYVTLFNLAYQSSLWETNKNSYVSYSPMRLRKWPHKTHHVVEWCLIVKVTWPEIYFNTVHTHLSPTPHHTTNWSSQNVIAQEKEPKCGWVFHRSLDGPSKKIGEITLS